MQTESIQNWSFYFKSLCTAKIIRTNCESVKPLYFPIKIYIIVKKLDIFLISYTVNKYSLTVQTGQNLQIKIVYLYCFLIFETFWRIDIAIQRCEGQTSTLDTWDVKVKHPPWTPEMWRPNIHLGHLRCEGQTSTLDTWDVKAKYPPWTPETWRPNIHLGHLRCEGQISTLDTWDRSLIKIEKSSK